MKKEAIILMDNCLFFHNGSGYPLQVLEKFHFIPFFCGLSAAIPNAGSVSVEFVISSKGKSSSPILILVPYV
jgi:hypothetical protein